MASTSITTYGSTEWHIQTDSVSMQVDDKGVATASVSWQSMDVATPVGGGDEGAPSWPAAAVKGQAFPFNGKFGVSCFCEKVSAQLSVGYTTVTAYYIGVKYSGSGGSADKSQVRTEWLCNTQASPIDTHPNFDKDLKPFAIIEEDLFVAFPASAPFQLGGVTDFLEPAATLRISWLEKYSTAKDNIKKWTGDTGRIVDPPSFAEFDLPTGTRDFLLNSYNFSFYAKPPEGDTGPIWADCSLEFLLSQEGGWNPLIYKSSQQAAPPQD